MSNQRAGSGRASGLMIVSVGLMVVAVPLAFFEGMLGTVAPWALITGLALLPVVALAEWIRGLRKSNAAE